MEYKFEIPAYFFSTWFIVACTVIFLLQTAGMWRVFEKAGKPGWLAIIPIVNFYIMIKIGGKSGWRLLLMIVPIANLVIAIWTLNLISKSFGKDEGFTVGLLLLSWIFWPILGFGGSKYLGPFGDPAAFAAHQNKFDFENKQ